VARGRAIEGSAYRDAVSRLAAAREHFWTTLADCDALIFPAAPDVAPVGMATGDARFVIPFTALGGPIMSIPTGFDQGLPLGIMLCGAPGTDRTLIAVGERIAALIETPR
jgi:aspartyl-tRNA(Asn)/glutamyl-tRNA(Gln) amidotransferase subunit A